MEHLHARNVVLGAGAMGSAAAYHLAKRGEPVVLVEQFALGHNRGSSHGAARITRHSYAEEQYARLMPEAFRAWRALEADAGRTLYVRCGGVSISPRGVDYAARVAVSLNALGVPYRRLTGRELARQFPVFSGRDDDDVVFEPDAGVLLAAQALSTELELARALGGEATRIIDNTRVHRVDVESERPVLMTDRRTITADRLLVTAGAWVGKLVPSLASRLRPQRQCVAYFRPDDAAAFSIGRFPVVIWKGTEPLDAFYGMPDVAGSGVKFARHGGPECDPDSVDREVRDQELGVVRDFLRGQIPQLAGAPLAASEVCLYTVAPDEDFVVGALAGRPDVIVASPCSGHGFKFSCLVGRVLADLAQRGQTDIDLSAWRTP